MRHKISLLTVLSVVSANCFALDISEPTLNTSLSLTFPRDIKGFHVENPKISLKDGNTIFCATATPKIFPKHINFCTSLVPKWKSETGSLHASNMSLTELSVDGLSEKKAESAKSSINNIVLPALDEIQIYQTKSWIGKQVKSIKVTPGNLSLNF